MVGEIAMFFVPLIRADFSGIGKGNITNCREWKYHHIKIWTRMLTFSKWLFQMILINEIIHVLINTVFSKRQWTYIWISVHIIFVSSISITYIQTLNTTRETLSHTKNVYDYVHLVCTWLNHVGNCNLPCVYNVRDAHLFSCLDAYQYFDRKKLYRT